jgi:hypothetical protein
MQSCKPSTWTCKENGPLLYRHPCVHLNGTATSTYWIRRTLSAPSPSNAHNRVIPKRVHAESAGVKVRIKSAVPRQPGPAPKPAAGRLVARSEIWPIRRARITLNVLSKQPGAVHARIWAAGRKKTDWRPL